MRKGTDINMKFKDFEYIRPDFDDIKIQFDGLILRLKTAECCDDAYEAISQINKLLRHVNTMMALCHTRHSIDTTDAYYIEESRYTDSNRPLVQGLTAQFYEVLVNHKYKSELKDLIGEHLFNLAKMKIRSFSPDILEELKEENMIVNTTK